MDEATLHFFEMMVGAFTIMMASFGIIALIVNLAIIGGIAWVIIKLIQAIANRNTKKDGS